MHIPKTRNVEVRGEVYMPKASFELLNKRQEEKGLKEEKIIILKGFDEYGYC